MSFCSGGTQASNSGGTQNFNQWANPLGPSSIGANGKPIFTPSGAAPLGAQTLSYLGSSLPQMNQAGQAYATALQGAAAAPGFGAAQTNATDTAAGDYLAGSPELNRALAQNNAVAGAGAADEAARARSTMAKNGMAWGTGQQQVEQATQAQANEAAANTNAQAYLQNYQAERGAQNNAGSQLAQAYSAPLSYLSGVPGAYTSGLNPAASLISGLGSGGSIYSNGASQSGFDQGITSPSTGSDILNTIGSL
jgi:hypothetical protein